MESKTYSIPNISCMHCVNKIQETIIALEGVDFAETDLTSKQLEVEFEAPASDQLIREALIAIGFPAN